MVNSITDLMVMNLSELWEVVEDREACHAIVHGVTNIWTQHMWDLQYGTNERVLETETGLSTQRPGVPVAKGEGGRENEGLELWVGRCQLLHLEWINNKVLMHSMGNYIQYPVISHNGKRVLKKNVYV